VENSALDWPTAIPGRPEVSLAGSGGLTGHLERVLDRVRNHLAKYVCTINDGDLDLITLWAAHTWVCEETYTSPRLLIDSPMPGSGKTTLLEHLHRLSKQPIQAASLTSGSLMARLFEKGTRTLLIDEADRSLDPKRQGVEELLAILNSGYKRGGTRPVNVPEKGGTWAVSEMTTFSPVAIAGNSPHLPEDTRSRCIRVLLLPDLEGRVESSDWEELEESVQQLGVELSEALELVRDAIRTERPSLPEGCKARNKERWYPLKRVAAQAGERWAALCDELILRDLEILEMDREDGLASIPPAVQLLKDLSEVWRAEERFIPTQELVTALIRHNPKQWSSISSYGRDLTAQRLGRMLARGFGVNSTRWAGAEEPSSRPRGYLLANLVVPWRRMGIPLPPQVTDQAGQTGQTGQEK
jgi:hypothetical protein